eukprot:CAMPEP_0178442638 /NCGR_PEP_ID=MMETSP0689_2-20121128/38312_1 /TAXON_ID=160604 /ORGANISM="Amphidinium massartii, Strain CS-259" /LENGTH=182 /DNA_ID=CAMNT_0020066279 /DNA_START=86 /DNA_END=631 /DNA_ORIENTATION=+
MAEISQRPSVGGDSLIRVGKTADAELTAEEGVAHTSADEEVIKTDFPEPSEGGPATTEAPAPEPQPEPAAKQVEADPAAENPFSVSLSTQGGRLGFRIGHKPGQDSLRVVDVHATGALADWNKENPARQVCVGCSILRINDTQVTSKDQTEMMKEVVEACRAPKLTMLVMRPPGDERQPAPA